VILKLEGYVADGKPVPLRKRKAKTWSGKNSQTIVETAPLIQQSSFRKYHHWRLGVGSIYKTKRKIQNKIWAIKGGQRPCNSHTHHERQKGHVLPRLTNTFLDEYIKRERISLRLFSSV